MIFRIGGKPGENRDLGAFLFGPTGQALIAYQREAAERHRGWVSRCTEKCSRLKDAQDEKNRYLPSFKYETIKMLKTTPCDIVRLHRG